MPDVVPAHLKLRAVLYGLGKVLRVRAAADAGFRALLSRRDAVFQIRLADGSEARWFAVRGGEVTSKGGVHSRPDAALVFGTPHAALTMLSLKPDYLGRIEAAKNFQLVMEGDDAVVGWMLEVLARAAAGEPTYGVDLGGGITRYTNNTNGGPVHVDVKDGRILRVTPIEFTDEDAPSWSITARGRRFAPPRKTSLAPHALSARSTVYSPDRLLHPLKRVDFDPHGDRHPETRGSAGYERISWDEALDLVADELMRVRRRHGPGSVFTAHGSHHTWGTLGYFLSAHRRFFNTVGSTRMLHNPDSWEGWAWGAEHHWGHSMRAGGGEFYGTVEDLLRECELVVFWSSDPEATTGIYAGMEGTARRRWLRELGIRCVHVDPYQNHTASWLGGTWLAPRPTTSVALAHAVAWVWVAEGLYDEEYVAARTTGFEAWRDYLLGADDGVPKTPEWQEAETGVPARKVRALARAWAAKKTYLAVGGPGNTFGGACRSATGIEWARSMVYLMAMRGLGKPGVNFGNLQFGAPVDTTFYFPGYGEGGLSGDLEGTMMAAHLYQRVPQLPAMNPVGQSIPRLRIPEALLEGQAEGWVFAPPTVQSQFRRAPYPEPGYSRVKLYYKYGGSFFGTMTETNRYVRAYRAPDLEFVVNQSIWFEGEARFADVILPACTNYERWDISEWANSSGILVNGMTQLNHRVIVLQHKCIEPLGESRSDWSIFAALAQRMGLAGPFAEGSDEFEWVRRTFEGSDLPKAVSWREFLRKGYYVVPPPSSGAPRPVAYRWFAEGRPKDTPDLQPLPGDYAGLFGEGLQTQSGKIEFVSSSLTLFDPDDPERPPLGRYSPSWEGPAQTELAAKYPLQLVSPHPRFSHHTLDDGKDSFVNDVVDHRVLIDGRYYWIARLHPQDAAARGIADGDLVRLFNDRGAIVCAARLTERVRPGVVHSYESSAVYEPAGEPGASADLGGCVNILTPSRPIAAKTHSMAPNSCLIEVEPWREGTTRSPVAAGA